MVNINKLNRKSYSRILKGVYLFVLFNLVCYFTENKTSFDLHREMYQKCLKKDVDVNITQNFLQYNDDTEMKTKPIMHTYVDMSNDYVEDDMLELWMTSWTAAGWDVNILTPEDAKSHSQFEMFDSLLKRKRVCCMPYQTYIRHLAMSTVPEGGFYSEAYVFPLPDLYLPNGANITLPNEGNFTSWDGIQGSLISGSYQEWNRMTQALMENINKNVVLSLIEISDESCDTYRHEDLVSDPTMLLSSGQFNSDLCTVFDKYLAIRFHPNEIVKHGIDIKDRFSIVSSYFKIYKARCLNERPIVFTFFEDVSNLHSEQPLELLEIWKTSWSDAGWNPVVLTMGDAKRHPDFKYYEDLVLSGYQFKNSRDRYNYFCFMRWVAISASGGGWLADYDTFPLKLPANKTLPNDGKFTGHSSYIPNILSGSLAEWNRMMKLLFNQVSKHDKYHFYSDMLALQDVLNSDNSSFITDLRSGQLFDFYSKEIADPNTKWRRLDPYDFTGKCDISDTKTTIHFSHYSCLRIWFCREEAQEDEDGNPMKQQRRGAVAQRWLEAWKLQCGDKFNPLIE